MVPAVVLAVVVEVEEVVLNNIFGCHCSTTLHPMQANGILHEFIICKW